MYHWTDSKIRVHAFYCMLGISLLNYLHAQARRECPRITLEQMKGESLKEFINLLCFIPHREKRGHIEPQWSRANKHSYNKFCPRHLGSMP